MTGNDRILTALRRGTPDRVPTFEWFIDASVCRALAGTADPVDAACALDLDGINVRPDYRRTPLDATTFTDEWGITRAETGDCIPCVTESPVKEGTRPEDVRFPDPEAPHRFATMERALRAADGRRAVILNLRDGFSDMRDLLGYEAALMQLALDPDAFKALLARVVDYNLALARVAVRRYGIGILATTDDVANGKGLLVSPAMYFDAIAPAFRRVVQGYKALGCLVIKHSDGDVRPLVDWWIGSGIDCLDPIDPRGGMRLSAMKAAYGDRICLKGNIDCAGVLQDGTESEVEAAVGACLREGGGSGHILSSSNTIHRGVPPRNYRAMLKALHRNEGRGTVPARIAQPTSDDAKRAATVGRPSMPAE
jgi:uroporphyrinogen decarboxylase